MTISSRWSWLLVPLALGLGSVAGVVIDRQILLRSEATRARAEAVQAEGLKVPEAPPGPPLPGSDRSPFDLDSNPPVPAVPEHGQGFSTSPFAAAPSAPEGPPPKVEPPFVVRDGRVEFEPPAGYFDLPAPDKQDGTDPPLIKPGQFLQVEVLEALPGRPITGDRVVRPDGTIGLYFYGDLRVAGLNRDQIKVKLLEHLRKFLKDEVLGLVGEHLDGSRFAIPPVESSRVFVDESINYWIVGQDKPIRAENKAGFPDQAPTNARFTELEKQLDRVIKTLEQLRQERRPAAAGAGAKPF